MSNTRYTFAVGTGFNAAGMPLGDLATRKQVAFTALAKQFGGFSASEVTGGWLDSNGQYIAEPSLSITVVTPEPAEQAEIAAEMLRATFEQTSVLLTAEPLSVIKFI